MSNRYIPPEYNELIDKSGLVLFNSWIFEEKLSTIHATVLGLWMRQEQKDACEHKRHQLKKMLKCILDKDTASLLDEGLEKKIQQSIEFRNEIAHPIKFQEYQKSIKSIFKDEKKISAADRHQLILLQQEMDKGLILLMQTSHQLNKLFDRLTIEMRQRGLSSITIKYPAYFKK